MIPRYCPPEIASVFSDESRLRRWLDVEILASEGWAEQGVVPPAAVEAMGKARIDPDRVAQLEAEQGHDVAAFVAAVQETLGPEGRYLHLGLTSSDVVDTALATQLRDAATIIDADLAALCDELAVQALRHRHTVMAGRTHGVHAEPITLGVKLANHLDETRRARDRLAAATAEVAVGQISGVVGTHGAVPPAVEEHVCRGLGLTVAPVCTQVVARDRHAAFVAALAIAGAVLERLATTIRLLAQTEAGEAEEPFGAAQKGSSAMPHKRNPVLSERICGLARVLRGHAATALEDIALWHERDISHSSAERVILPDACALLAYMLRVATRLVRGLRIDVVRMRTNLERDGGIVFSQRVLQALVVDAGWAREDAYRAVQELAARARSGEAGFRELVEASPTIGVALGPGGVERCFDVNAFLAHVEETYRRLGLDTRMSPAPDGGGAGGAQSAGSAAGGPRPALAVEAGIGGGIS